MKTLSTYSYFALTALALIVRTSFCMDPKALEFSGIGQQARISPPIRLISSSSQSLAGSAPQQSIAQNPRGMAIPRVLNRELSLGLIPAGEIRQALDGNGELTQDYSSMRTLVIYQDSPELMFGSLDTARIFYLRNTLLGEILWIPYNSFKSLVIAARGKPNAQEVLINNLMRYITEQRNHLLLRK